MRDGGISRWARWALAAALIVIGGVVAAGGVWLLALGGSAYYGVAGAMVLGAGVLVLRGDRRGAWFYALFLLASTVWALWEAGPEGWALTARLFAPALLGCAFALPGVLTAATAERDRFAPHAAVAAALFCFVTIAFGATRPLPAPAPFPQAIANATFAAAGAEWRAFGGEASGNRYSTLDQVTPENVVALQVAWTHDAGATEAGARSPMQTTPIMVGGTLYYCAQTNVVIALDPETGEERWRHDPDVTQPGPEWLVRCRGVAHYSALRGRDCAERIFTVTFDARLIALDARTGRKCSTFGDDGEVDLTEGLGDVPTGYYYVTSAPLVLRGSIILGGSVIDNASADAPSGVIRAFDAETGALRWAWDMGRPDARAEARAGEIYSRSTPNSWAPASADEELGLIYLPLGNPAPDHWGASRSPQSERFGSSVVALDAATGALRWSLQTMHHDLWDYDVPAQPTLVNIQRGGEIVPALVQPTKRGQLFVLDRRTGEPISPVEERPAPQRGGVADDRLSPTQPHSVGMPSFTRDLRERDMWGLTPIDQLACRIAFRRLRYEGEATPPGLTPSLIYPGVGGGMNWGGVAVDPVHGVAIVNTMNMGATIQLIPRAEAEAMAARGGDAPQPMSGTPYAAQVSTFYSPLRVPCNEPPFGELSAVDLSTGALLWRRPFGTARDSGPFGRASRLPLSMGLPNLGGSLVTESGLVFIGAAAERRFRAFDVRTGRELWSAELPAGGQANPMTYVSPRSGRQFVVIAASGHPRLQMQVGDTLVAFALPAAN